MGLCKSKHDNKNVNDIIEYKNNFKLPNKKMISKILIVDDIVALSENLIEYFKLLKYDVTIDNTFDGINAIKMINENKYDLIMMDIIMKPIDGYETSNRIRKLNYDGVILGVTGMASNDAIKKAMDSGIDRILFKPYTFDKLIEVINDIGFILNKK